MTDHDTAKASVRELDAAIEDALDGLLPLAIIAALDLRKLNGTPEYPDPIDAGAELLHEMVTHRLGVTPAVTADVTDAVTCPGCGQPFARSRIEQVACSVRCRVRLHRSRQR